MRPKGGWRSTHQAIILGEKNGDTRIYLADSQGDEHGGWELDLNEFEGGEGRVERRKDGGKNEVDYSPLIPPDRQLASVIGAEQQYIQYIWQCIWVIIGSLWWKLNWL